MLATACLFISFRYYLAGFEAASNDVLQFTHVWWREEGMQRLAILGGDPVRTKRYPAWPFFDESEERAILGVLRSGQSWHALQGESSHPAVAPPSLSKTAELELAFARAMGAKRAIPCASGTTALEVALRAGVRR
jgi:hypothetical protein